MGKIIVLFLFLFVFIFSCSSEKTGSIQIIAGTGKTGFKDGKTAELNKPIRLAPYAKNSIIFADINNHAIRIATLDGEVTTIAGGPEKAGYQDGPAKEAKFKSPVGAELTISICSHDLSPSRSNDIRVMDWTKPSGELRMIFTNKYYV